MARASSVRPAPTRPATPTISPRRTEKEMSRSRPRLPRWRTSRTVSPTSADSLAGDLVEVAADHHRDEVAHVGLRHRPGGDVAAVAEDGDAVAEAEDLLHAVRDVDDAEALRTEAADHLEEEVGLALGERGGRLVEDDDARRRRRRAGDGDDLALGDGEGFDDRLRVERDAEPVEQRAGLAVHAAIVDEAEAADRLAAEEDVLGDAEIGLEVELLVHRDDAEGLGVGRVGDRAPSRRRGGSCRGRAGRRRRRSSPASTCRRRSRRGARAPRLGGGRSSPRRAPARRESSWRCPRARRAGCSSRPIPPARARASARRAAPWCSGRGRICTRRARTRGSPRRREGSGRRSRA